MSRVMAIDFGMRRIGVALSDPLRMVASGYETVNWNGVDHEYALERISQIVKEKEVTEIVMGKPSRTDGTQSETEEKAIRFSSMIEEKTGIKPVFRDERFTTVIGPGSGGNHFTGIPGHASHISAFHDIINQHIENRRW